MIARARLKVAAVVALALLINACSYDYLQHTDRVGYSAGNAVRANMAIQTSNPTSRAHYVTSGLGANGSVIPAAEAQVQP